MKLYFTPNTRSGAAAMKKIIAKNDHPATWDAALESFIFSGSKHQEIKKALSPEMKSINGNWESV